MTRFGLLVLAWLCFANVAAADPLSGRLIQTVTPLAYRLDLTVRPEQPRFSAHVEIEVRVQGGERSVLLHGRKLHVTRVSVRQGAGKIAAQYREVDPSGVARVEFAKALEPGAAQLVFDYDAAFGVAAGLYHLKVAEHWYAWTQLEAVDARAMFPCFDQPEFKTPFTISVATPPDAIAASNEALTRSQPEGALVRHQFAPSAPLPTYLVALAVGPFDVLEGAVPPTPQRPKPLPLRILATQGQKASLAYALAETQPIVTLLEAYFDRPFPFSKLDQIASPLMGGGAMENAGAVMYDDSLIVLGADASVQARRDFGMVVAHELAHQWFGDLVTPVWWEDIWLNESFANWLGYLVADRWRPELNIGNGSLQEGFRAMDLDALHAGRPIHQPIRVTGEILGAFDAITYGKGGKVIEMIAAYLGPERFQKGVRSYMQRFAGGSAASSDFFQAMADAAQEPRLVAAMQGFVEQQGVPVVRVERDGTALKWTQARYAPIGAPAPPATRWTVPFCLRLGTNQRCQLLDSASGSLPLPGRTAGALMPNVGGHGYYRFSLSGGDWAALIASAPQLGAGEALAVLDSSWAEWRAGALALPVLLQEAIVFSGHADSYIPIDVGDRLAGLRERGLLATAQLPAYRKQVSQLFGPRLAQLGFKPGSRAHAADSNDTQRLRVELVHFMSAEAEDAATRRTLQDAAAAWVEGQDDALDRALLSDGIEAWVTRAGASGLQRAWARLLASNDADARARIASALGSLGDPTAARWLLDHLRKGSIRSTEKLTIIDRMIRTPETREIGFAWLERNLTKLADEGIFAALGVFGAVGTYCSADDATRVERSLRPQIDKLQLWNLELQREVEKIRNCGALRQAHEAELQAAFPAGQ